LKKSKHGKATNFAASNRITQVVVIMASIIKAYKFRILNPSKIVQERLAQTLRLCKDLYNGALQERRDAYQINRISINYTAQAAQLFEIKTTNAEYKEIHSQVLQNVLKRVERAFDGFFRRIKTKQKAGFPRFKSQSRYDSFTFPQSGFNLSENKLTVSKIGKVKIKLSRKIQGKVKTCQIKREIDKWFVIFTVETLPEEGLPKTGKTVGIDAGIAAFLTLSDGTQIENNRFYESTQKKLRIVQRSVARKRRGGQKRKKAVLKLRQLHQKIKNQHADFRHKVSTYLIKTFDVICIEKLNLAGLTKGRLAKQMHDISIGNFFNILRYKAENADKKLIEIPAAYTSQTCHACGHCEKANRQSQADFECLKCRHKNNADVNAAKNILRLGINRLALSLPLGEFAKESPVF
jgi:putative transposase